MKAYWVEESRRGITHHLVWANSIREIRENWPDVERQAVEHQDHPGGLHDIRRAPEEDR